MENLKIKSTSTEYVSEMIVHEKDFQFDMEELLKKYNNWNDGYIFKTEEELRFDFIDFIKDSYDDELLDHITGDFDSFDVMIENWDYILPYLKKVLKAEEYCPYCHQKMT